MSNIIIGRMVIGSVQTNTYFLYRDTEGTKKGVVVDPADQGAKIFEALKENGIEVEGILLTHGHFDHILGVAKLRQLSHCSLYANEDEVALLADTGLNCSASFGMECTATADVTLKDGEVFEIAGIEFTMIATPGHTSGSCCYYVKEAELLISGDTLFEGSVGRTDFPTGSMSELVHSCKEKLFKLPEKTIVYPGHGLTTTIGDEKTYNPFLA